MLDKFFFFHKPVRIYVCISLMCFASLPFNHNNFLLNFFMSAEASPYSFTKDRSESLIKKGNELIYTDPELSIEPLNKAFLIYRHQKDQRGQKDALHSLGIAYEILQDYRNSIKYHQAALKIIKNMQVYEGQTHERLDLMQMIASSYMYLGEADKSIETHLEVLSLAQNNSLEMKLGSLGALGEIYLDQKVYDTAEYYLRKALELSRGHSQFGIDESILSSLGELFSKTGRMEDAEKAFSTAFQIKEFQTIDIDQLLAIQLAPFYQRINGKSSAQMQEELKNFYIKEPSLYMIKLLKSEELAPYCNEFQKILIARGKFFQALTIAERCRARPLSQFISAQLSANSSLKNLPPLEIPQIQNIARERNVTFVEYSLLYEDSISQQKLIRNETQLLIWVIQPSGEMIFRQVGLSSLGKSPKPLQRLIANTRQSMGLQGRASISIKPIAQKFNHKLQIQNLQQLYQILIQPVADLLPKEPEAQVVFVPHESLFLAPLSALQDPKEKYLIEKHTISTSPSIQTFDVIYRKPRQHFTSVKPNVLVVGNPTMPQYSPDAGTAQPLPALPGSEIEAKAIAEMFSIQSILGEEATETKIVSKMSQANIIHLATHGLIDDVRPSHDNYFLNAFRFLGLVNSRAKVGEFNLRMPGAIALAPSSKDDGLLKSDEVSKLKLKAELVVLSACNTGQGQILSEGAVGISRAFIAAGARSVIASLWIIPDSPTAELMTTFYRNWKKYKLNKAQALRQAMLTTMQDHPDPEDWAALY
jgi:CHAT domain-containing protein